MAWASPTGLDQLSLTSSYQIVEDGSVDYEETLNPGEIAQVVFDYNYTVVSSDEDGWCDILIEKTLDGTTYESEDKALRIILTTVDDPDIQSITIAGCYGFRIKARLRDNDDTVWSGDYTATLDTDIRKDGVNI